MCILCGYCVDLFNVLFIFATRLFDFISRFSIDLCVTMFVLDVKTMSGATFHLLVLMLLTSR